MPPTIDASGFNWPELARHTSRGDGSHMLSLLQLSMQFNVTGLPGSMETHDGSIVRLTSCSSEAAVETAVEAVVGPPVDAEGAGASQSKIQPVIEINQLTVAGTCIKEPTRSRHNNITIILRIYCPRS